MSDRWVSKRTRSDRFLVCMSCRLWRVLVRTRGGSSLKCEGCGRRAIVCSDIDWQLLLMGEARRARVGNEERIE